MNIDLVRQEIERIPGKKTISDKRVMILCPFHQETKPSGKISVDTSYPGSIGSYYCWGCGTKKKWNDIAEVFGLKKMNGKNAMPKHVPKIDLSGARERVLPQEVDKIEDYDFFELQEPRWRGFNKEFLEDLGAKLAYHDKTQQFYVWFPVRVEGKQAGYFRARMKPEDDKPSYLNKSGSWVKRRGLFPFDQAIKLMLKLGLKTLVLVEGPRDALRMIRQGIPAVSIMGTNNWSSNKRQIVENAGVERLIILMDGDKPGKRATYGNPKDDQNKGIYEDVKINFEVIVFKLWKTAKRMALEQGVEKIKLDPYNMPKEIVEKVRSKLI